MPYDSNYNFRENFKKNFSKNFSQNKRRFVDKLSKKIGETAAIALVGNERTSKMEIQVVADIISYLNDLDIYSYRLNPNKAVLVGRTPQGNKVHIHPQYRVAQPNRIFGNNRQEYWYIDMAIELYSLNYEDLIIGLWGVEYDGFPGHFTEPEIKKGMFRDVVLENEIGMKPIHITKENWQKHPHEYINNMLYFFERRNFELDGLSESELELLYGNVFGSPELDVLGEGVCKAGRAWENVERSD